MSGSQPWRTPPRRRRAASRRSPRRGSRRLGLEELPAGGGDHRGRDPLGLQQVARRRARPRPRCRRRRWSPPRGPSARAARRRRGRTGSRRCLGADAAARSGATGPAPTASSSRSAPASSTRPSRPRRRGGRRGGWAWRAGEARCSTGWWVGPSSPRPMKSWVITWMTRHAHQRREADRRAAVVGEDQEGAAVGDHPAVQRHAVHRRGHAVLAHAVVDVAAGVVAGRRTGHALDEGVVGAGEVGRAADHLRDGGDETLERHAGVLAGGVRRGSRRLGDDARRAPRRLRRQVAGHGALELGLLRRGGEPGLPGLAGLAPRGGRRRARRRHLVGHREGLGGPAQCWRASAISSSNSGEPWMCGVPSLSGAPWPIWCGRRSSSAAWSARAAAIAAAIWPGSWPSTAFTAQPAALKRASWSVGRERRRPSMVVSLSSQSTVSRPSFSRPARPIASWLTPSIRQPSPAITQVRWSTRSSPKRAASMPLGHGHADGGGQALAQRAGGGLDARRVAVLGVARRVGAELPEGAGLVHAHVRRRSLRTSKTGSRRSRFSVEEVGSTRSGFATPVSRPQRLRFGS